MKKINSFFKSKTFGKIFAMILICGVLVSSFAICSSAADDYVYESIAPIYFYEFDRLNASASFRTGDDIILNSTTNGVTDTERTYLNNNDYYLDGSLNLFTKNFNGSNVYYFRLFVYCQYSSIYVNSQAYNSSVASFSNPATLTNVFELSVYPVTGSSIGGYNTFVFDIVLATEQQAYDRGYNAGFTEGESSGFTFGRYEGYNAGYADGSSSTVVESARTEGYNAGYAAGRESTDSANLGQNLIGDTLSAPMDGLNDFVLYDSDGPDGEAKPITLGLIVGGAIALTLFMAFLKLFAGG